MPRYVSTVYYGGDAQRIFGQRLYELLNLLPGDGVFSADHMLTHGKSLNFLRPERFTEAVLKNNPDNVELGCIWRTHVLCWAARQALRVPGDLVETGCYRGYSSKVICDYLNFDTLGRQFFLYDLFEHGSDMPHHGMPAHGKGLHEQVVERFADYSNVRIIKGQVPDSFAQGEPERIAFIHIDLNHAESEIAVLERFFERVPPGGVIIFDDYGWLGYAAQQRSEEAWLAARGYGILELPTGQGMVIK